MQLPKGYTPGDSIFRQPALATTNRIAVALGLANTATTLEQLHSLAGRIGLAEIRLDLMQEFDVERLIGESPWPAGDHLPGAPRGRGLPRIGVVAAGTPVTGMRPRLCVCGRRVGLCGGFPQGREYNQGDRLPPLSRLDAARHRRTVPGKCAATRTWSSWSVFAGQPVDTLPVLELIAGADSPVIRALPWARPA